MTLEQIKQLLKQNHIEFTLDTEQYEGFFIFIVKSDAVDIALRAIVTAGIMPDCVDDNGDEYEIEFEGTEDSLGVYNDMDAYAPGHLFNFRNPLRADLINWTPPTRN